VAPDDVHFSFRRARISVTKIEYGISSWAGSADLGSEAPARKLATRIGSKPRGRLAKEIVDWGSQWSYFTLCFHRFRQPVAFCGVCRQLGALSYRSDVSTRLAPRWQVSCTFDLPVYSLV
jgi:hypothetical protein